MVEGVTLVVGITGRARSGKNTVAEIVRELLGPGAVEVRGFSDGLKASAARSLGYQGENPVEWGNGLKFSTAITLTRRDPAGTILEERTLSGREYLQLYGTEAHRDLFGADFWTSRTLEEPSGELLVIPDLRFDDEAQAIHALGGEVWEVLRPGDAIADSAHSSEQGIDVGSVTRWIDNGAGVPELRQEVATALGRALQSHGMRGQA